MPIGYLFIFLSFIIGIFSIKHLLTFDLHEKEPFFTMALVTLWGGICSVIAALVLYRIAYRYIPQGHNTLNAFLVVGPIEECAKLLALLTTYPFIRKKIDEPTDGVIYIACVALGFSLIENHFYAMANEYTRQLIFLRLFICTPAHIAWSVFMGIGFYTILKYKSGVKLLFLAYLYAVFMHGLYDAVAFKGWEFIILLILIKISHVWAVGLLEFTNAISPYRKSLKEFIETFPEAAVQKGIECLHCGNQNSKATYQHEKILIQKCDQCLCYVCTRDTIFYIFRCFGSKLENMSNYYLTSDVLKEKYSRLFEGNYISDKKKIAFFYLDELNEIVEQKNKETIEGFEKYGKKIIEEVRGKIR